jgi:multidrug efflux pump subunit AcrB
MKRFNLSEWAIQHRSLVSYFMLVIVIAGVWSYFRLGRSEDPDFTVKTMVVQAAWPGATVSDTLEQITDRLERKLQETPNLDYLKSYTTAGQTTIFVNLKDSTLAAQVPDIWYQVRKKLADIRNTLPQGIVGRVSTMSLATLTASSTASRRTGSPIASCGITSMGSASSCSSCRTSRKSMSWARRMSASMSSFRPSNWRDLALTALR